MRALDFYKSMLIELDKHESPSFSIQDFNHFATTTVNEFLDSKHIEGPDNLQASHDDIEKLLSDPTQLSFGKGGFSNIAPLPNSYRNILDLEVVLKFTSAKGKYLLGDTIRSAPRKMRSARKGFIENNVYQKANLKRTWYRLRQGNIQILHDPAVIVKSGIIEFMKKPSVIYLNPDFTSLSASDKLLEVNNTTLEFPDHTVNKLVRLCRRIVLENIESTRYSTILNENQLSIN